MKDTSGRSDDSLPVRRSSAPPLSPPHGDYADDYRQDMPQPPPSKKFSVRMVGRALRRHWWQALLLWSAGTAGMVAFAYNKIHPTFDASALVKVEFDNTVISGAGSQQLDLGLFMQNQASIIANPMTIGAALSVHPELASTPLLRHSADRELDYKNALQVFIVPRTQFITIQMGTQVPGEADKLVNAVVEAYLKHATEIYDSSNQKKIDLLKVTRDEQNVIVQDRRKVVQSLMNTMSEADIGAVKDRMNTTLEAFRRWNEELTNVDIRVLTAKARLDQLRGLKEVPRQAGGEPGRAQVEEMFLNDPEVVALQARIEREAQKLKEVTRLSRHHSDPSVVRADERVKELNKQRDDLWRLKEPQIRQKLASGPVDTSNEEAIRAAENELAATTVHRDTLQNRLDQVKIANTNAQGDQNKLLYAKRDLERSETVLDKIDDTLNQLRFESRNPTARVELVNQATPSIRANSDRRKQVMASAPFVVGMLVTALMMLLEFRGGRVSDPDEIASRMNLQVIGVVPPLPQIRIGTVAPHLGGPPATTGDIRAQRQLDEFVQSLDHLRVALCARRDQWGRDRHCVLITSAIGSEGKTTLAAQLAERCVNAGLMTLLIDADLRNPTLSRMLDASDSPGLINVLRGEMLAEDVVMVVGDAGGFHLLPAGTPRVDPSRLLQSDRLGKLIAQARESFDMIIVDAPPVLPVPDALTIGRWTDGAVLAVRYDTSRYPLVERANRRLAHVGVPVIGVVVNGVRSMESTYGGSYGYGSSVYGNVPTSTVGE